MGIGGFDSSRVVYKIIINFAGDSFIFDQIGLNVHNLFKENKIESLFYDHYCK